MMLTAVICDLMDTVVRDPYREAIAAGVGAPFSEVARHLDRDAWPDFELGRIDEATFAARFLRPGSPYRLDLDALNTARREGYRPLPGMLELLDDLDGVADRHLATNYPVWVGDVLDACSLSARVEGVHASTDLGARKPDRAFYERMLERTGLDPRACLFVDDRADNCDAAAELGMRAHHFTDARDLRGRLRAEGAAIR